MDIQATDHTPNSLYYHISLHAKLETLYQVFRQLGFQHLVLGTFYIVRHPVYFDGYRWRNWSGNLGLLVPRLSRDQLSNVLPSMPARRLP